MSRRMWASAVLAVGVLVAVVVLGGCGTSSESSSSAVCPDPLAGSPSTNGPDSPAGSPNAPKLTALEIAERLPSMPSAVRWSGGVLGPSLFGDDWNDFGGTLDPHVASSAVRGWAARSERAFGNEYSFGGSMQLRVYDSPAARLAAEQSESQGVYSEPKIHGGSDDPTWVVDEHHYRCFASCGAVSIAVVAEETREVTVAWANGAIVQSQEGLEQIFGGCPAWDDMGAPPTEMSP
jgi:hypothetical protein